ncbi:MAG: zinc-dependent metalloprotease, partial [Aquabacterium sp.]|nr:zinc-dependent metalloprotease [Aquabacterium sp.]
AAGQPPPFATVIKDARKSDGLFTAWQKDERLWLELRPEDFNRPFFLSPKLRTGIGEGRLFGGLMLGSPRLVQFRRQHNVVQLLAINEQQIAKPGTPEARAVAAAISPSLLGANLVASQPHPERKSVLVDAGAIFLSDMMGLGGQLQRSYRQGYGLDPRNSAVLGVRGQPDLLVVETNNHFVTANIAVPQPGAPPGAPVPTTPSGVPDARSLFLGLHYSLARLPAQPMAARPADPRVGHFISVTDDFSDDLARSPRQRVVNRWRLEKKDPAAELSEPVKPITYWLDRNIPLKYRAAITAGVLEWNKAFERIGFKNAIEVKQQPDDADWDTLDAGVASLRWMVNREPGFGAIGPSHVDPRSGEILDADIALESLSSRNLRNLRARVLGATGTAAAAQEWADLLQVGQVDTLPAFDGAIGAGPSLHDPLTCRHADQAAEQLGYAMDVLAARGEIDPDSPEAQQFVLDYMKDVTMHEVGHTLGLRHNFRASHAISAQQVADPEFTRREAFTGSVMEYAPVNLPRPGEKAAAPFQATLGAYDYWAIEYAYKPLAPDQQATELARIAARSGEPGLAYGTDEDNFLGIDPEALQFDLGDDVLAFAARRFDIARDLFSRQETRALKPDEDFGSLRRALAYAVRDAGRAAGILMRQSGGVRTLRDYPNTGRDPLQPVPSTDQRAALQLLSQRVLAADSFVVSPALQRKLAPNFFERGESPAVPTEFALAQTVLDLQRAILNRLMSDAMAARVLDNQSKVSPPAQALHLTALYQQLETDVWSELAAAKDIAQPRRELQREYINRMTALVLRPGTMSRSDARSLVRTRAAALAQHIEQASRRGALGAEARAHLQDSAESLRAALAAPLQRAGG